MYLYSGETSSGLIKIEKVDKWRAFIQTMLFNIVQVLINSLRYFLRRPSTEESSF
jgi:hypothetical protein